jgi:predicted nuclease of predicted toxin-antitoxin system
MNFFLDENFPRPALAQLQSAGHTAVHALDIFPPGTADDHLFAHAQQQQAVFITTDNDLLHTAPCPLPNITGRW